MREVLPPLRSGSVPHKQIDNRDIFLEVVFEALVFVQNHNFRVNSQNLDLFAFHEKHLSLLWVAAVSFSIHHHASCTVVIFIEQNEEDRFLVFDWVLEGEFQGLGQLPRVAIVATRPHLLAHVVLEVLDPHLLHGCTTKQ